jgi:hypothetical protein
MSGGVSDQDAARGAAGGRIVAEFALRLHPGFGSLGEFGVEAA